MFKKRFDYIDFRIGDIYEAVGDVLSCLKDRFDLIKNDLKLLIYRNNEIFESLKNVGASQDELKNQIDCVESMIARAGVSSECNENEIHAGLKELRETQLCFYEDVATISNVVNKSTNKLSDEMKTVVESVANLDDKLDYTLKMSELKQKIQELKVEVALLKKQNENLTDENLRLRYNVNSLTDSFAVVAQGVYNQENIEFAGIKTYRDGWRYLCYNGRQMTNFNDIKEVDIRYYKGERLLMDISFDGE